MNTSANLSKVWNPLCVDLDGTLIASDLLHEAVFQLLRLNVLYLIMLPVWLMRGKAVMKREIAERVTLDAATLPYNEELLTFIRAERKKGRKVVLVTASDAKFAAAIASHLGLFDDVLASNGKINLSSHTKARLLVDRYGEKYFDYIGNSKADIAVWDKAANSIIVGNDLAAKAYARRNEEAAHVPLNDNVSRVKVWLRTIRIHQWLKNTLLFVPFILTGEVFDIATWLTVTQAFIAFGLCASSVYILNDIIDLQADRQHSKKRNRPLAAGLVSITEAALVAVLFLVMAFVVAIYVSPLFMLVLGLYYVLTLTYSLYLKRKLLLDVLALAGLFTIRLFAGAAAIEDSVSAWFLAFSVFFFLSLALVKRFVELSSQDVEPETGKIAGRGYRPVDLETLSQSGIASGFSSVLVLSLFVNAPETRANYATPELLWLICPLVLYIVVRIWILARRREMHDDPVVFLMSDWRSQLMIASGAFAALFAKLV